MDAFKSGKLNSEPTAWQKKQAAMLYHFTSPDYLKTLHQMVTDLINGFVDPLLDMAKAQNRDPVLINNLWGNRNTSKNWANYAWPFLKDLQASLAEGIAQRAANRFLATSVDECIRGVSEYSLEWMTPGEEQMLKLALSTISDYAGRLDRSVAEHENRWNDYRFAYNYPSFAASRPVIPKFIISNNVVAKTGEVPPRAGVYMCADDPHASMQFAWTEDGGIELRVANTFNDIGLAALSAVGRAALWFDEGKMFDFATSQPYAALFHDSVFLDGEPCPSLAPAAVARASFTTRSCRWVLVEPVPGQFEDLAAISDAEVTPMPATRRIAGGERCVEAGFYFTPSSPDSRRFFAKGEIAPKLDSHYGITYWQWDSNQNP